MVPESSKALNFLLKLNREVFHKLSGGCADCAGPKTKLRVGYQLPSWGAAAVPERTTEKRAEAETGGNGTQQTVTAGVA